MSRGISIIEEIRCRIGNLSRFRPRAPAALVGPGLCLRRPLDLQLGDGVTLRFLPVRAALSRRLGQETARKPQEGDCKKWGRGRRGGRPRQRTGHALGSKTLRPGSASAQTVTAGPGTDVQWFSVGSLAHLVLARWAENVPSFTTSRRRWRRSRLRVSSRRWRSRNSDNWHRRQRCRRRRRRCCGLGR